MDTFSTKPDANVIFYPYKYEDDSKIPKGREMEVNELAVQEHLIEVQTSKTKGSPGTFSILLDSSKNWKSLLMPGTWCLIYLKDSPLTGKEESEPDSGLKMIGIVRSIMRQESIDPSGIKRVRFLVTGEDFQAVFNAPVYLNANMFQVLSGQGIGRAAALTIYGDAFNSTFSPSSLIKLLVDTFLGKPAFEGEKSGRTVTKPPLIGARSGQPYKVPQPISKRVLGSRAPGDFFTGLITFFLQKDLIGRFFNPPEVTGTPQIWSLLQSFCHTLLNELYTDLLPVNVDGKTRLLPSMVLRSIPFSSKAGKPFSACTSMLEAGGDKSPSGAKVGRRGRGGNAVSDRKTKKGYELPVQKGAHFYVSRDISEGEVVGLTCGKSDRERFNFFLVFPNFNEFPSTEIATLTRVLDDGISSIANVASIARNGLRPYIAKTPYDTTKESRGDLLAINRIVRDLWRRAHLFESGQVELIGQANHIPVGTNIRFVDRSWIAHVEAVSHSFKVSPDGVKNYRTQISFVRLMMSNGDPVDLIEKTDENDQRGVVPTKDKEGIDRGVTWTRTDK